MKRREENMKNNLIFSALAISEGKETSVNLSSKKGVANIYYQNVVVSLVSAKINNPQSDVALATNVDVPKKYADIFKRHGISIFVIPFDNFVFDGSYKWCLAFYKLCALKKILELGYKKVCMVDSDTYFSSSIDDLFEESDGVFFLYNLNRRLNAPGRKDFSGEVVKFGLNPSHTLDVGGEIIAGDCSVLSSFLSHCLDVYTKMKKSGFETSFGDEFILRISAYPFIEHIRPANSYLFRYWTGSFQLTSTNYLFNKVSIYHVPQEKEFGMIKLFKFIYRKKRLPSNSRVIRVLHLKHRRPILYLKFVLLKFMKAINERFYWD